MVEENKRGCPFMEEDGYVVVYVSKDCIFRLGLETVGIWFGEGHPLNVSKYGGMQGTADIQAFVEAINIAFRNDVRRLKIKTDSQYVFGAMTGGIDRWETNGWKNTYGEDVRDAKDFMILNHACQLMDAVSWELVNNCQDAKMLTMTTLSQAFSQNGAT